MFKGLTLTLMAVLMTVAALQAQAEAPIISGMPDAIVVGDNEGPTTNTFVFPDAVNLAEKVTDADTTSDSLLWSFVDLTGTYVINGVESLDLGTEDPLAPGAKAVNVADADPLSSDSLVETITVRNADLSPIGGANTDPVTTGLQASATVTFYVTDQDNLDSATIMIYTDNDGDDRLSGGEAFEDAGGWDFATDGAGDWTVSVTGSMTASQTTGLCLAAPLTGENFGSYVGPDGMVEMSANSIYKLHLTMTSTNTAANSDPLWDVVVENQNAGLTAAYLWASDFWFLDNIGGANNVENSGGTFDIYFAPGAVNTTAFTDYVNTPANAGMADGRIVFRVLDLDSVGYGAQTDAATMCVESIDISKAPMSSVVKGTEVYNKTSWVAADYTCGVFTSEGYTLDEDGTEITFGATGNWTLQGVYFYPGAGRADVTDSANFPITWEDQTIYMMEMDMKALSGNPLNFIDMLIETASGEFYAETYVIGKQGNILMPTTETTTYVAFLNGANLGATEATNQQKIRAHGYAGVNTGIEPGTYNGSVAVEEIRVYKVTVQ